MAATSVELLSPSMTAGVRTPPLTGTPARPTDELVRIHHGRTSGWGLARLGVDCLQRLASAPELLFTGAQTWLKNQPGHRVALVESESAPGTWCCKERTTRSLWVRLVAGWAPIRAHNACHQGLALLQAQVNTPQPLAIMAVDRCGEYHEYLLTAAIPAAVSLQHWLSTQEQRRSAADFRVRGDLLRQLGLQLQRLHQHGFDHRDLKPTNILISEHLGRSQVWLIDLDGVWRWPWIPGPRRVQNLARLWAGVATLKGVTRTDALRLLRAYLTPEQQRSWKTLWRRIARRSAVKIRQQAALAGTSASLQPP